MINLVCGGAHFCFVCLLVFLFGFWLLCCIFFCVVLVVFVVVVVLVCSLLLVVVVGCCCCCFVVVFVFMLVFCCYCCCCLFVCLFVFVVLFLLLFLLFVCPRTPQQINKKTTETLVSLFSFALCPCQGFAQREANNPKQTKTKGLYQFSFVSLPCCVLLCISFFLLFLFLSLFFCLCFSLASFDFIPFSFSSIHFLSSLSFELQRRSKNEIKTKKRKQHQQQEEDKQEKITWGKTKKGNKSKNPPHKKVLDHKIESAMLLSRVAV